VKVTGKIRNALVVIKVVIREVVFYFGLGKEVTEMKNGVCVEEGNN